MESATTGKPIRQRPIHSGFTHGELQTSLNNPLALQNWRCPAALHQQVYDNDLRKAVAELDLDVAGGCSYSRGDVLVDDSYNANHLSGAYCEPAADVSLSTTAAAAGSMAEPGDQAPSYIIKWACLLLTGVSTLFACGLCLKPSRRLAGDHPTSGARYGNQVICSSPTANSPTQ